MRAGSLIVKFKADSDQLEQNDSHNDVGAKRVQPLLGRNTVRVDVGDNHNTEDTIRAYRSDPSVERVEPDYIVRATGTPNDPLFNQQWGMTKIRAPEAWTISTSAPTTKIAILDCGIYHESTSTYLAPDGLPGHPDLRGPKLVESMNFTPSPTSDDLCNHGTHVAGIAAANTDTLPALGVAGVGDNASLVNVKVLGDNGSGSFTGIINGINWVANCQPGPTNCNRRADIINMSLGATAPCSASVQEAINNAWAAGVLIVAAAGNSGASGAITPANCLNVIGVAASDQNDAKASFSNHGAGVDVAAPGVGILSTDYVGGYSSFNGTSMASPHVAGLAALLWTTAYGTNNQAVADRIACTANENFLAGSSSGRIDAYNALAAALGDCAAPPPPPPPPSLTINDVSVPEGNAGTTTAIFTVSRAGSTSQGVSVNFATALGSATGGSACGAGVDYVSANGTAVIPAGSTSATISISVCGDTVAEASETFFVNLSGAIGATIADSQGIGTITNDDAAPGPSITITDVSRSERNSGTRNFNFTVRLSASSSQTVTVGYATANGTATGGTACGSATDYLARSGALSFSPGQTSKTVSVPVCGDRVVELNETFVVNLTGPANATIADGQGVGTITNDD